MPIREDLYEKMIADREHAEKEARRADLRRWLAVLAVCILWQIVGGAITTAGFVTVMPKDDALELVWGGLGVAVAGTVLTILIMSPKSGGGE